MLDVLAAASPPIVAEDVVLPEPANTCPSAPLVAIEPAAIPEPASTPAPGPVPSPQPNRFSKPATVPEPARQGVRQGQPDARQRPAPEEHQSPSIQLMGSPQLDTVAQFVRVNRLADQVWIYRTNYHGSPRYGAERGLCRLSQAQAGHSSVVASPAEGGSPGPNPSQVNRRIAEQAGRQG